MAPDDDTTGLPRPASPPVVRPRTVDALGPPEPLPPETPWLSPPLEAYSDLVWQPPTGQVAAMNIEASLADPDIWSFEPEELEIVAAAGDPLDLLVATTPTPPATGAISTDERAGPVDDDEAAWAEIVKAAG